MPDGDYLERWFRHTRGLRSGTLREPIRVRGIEDRHLGPRWSRASVSAVVEPAEHLDVVFQLPAEDLDRAHSEGFSDWAVFGFLDVLLTARDYPITRIRLVIHDLGIDPVDSSPMAFRRAGRAAARQLVDQADLMF